MTLRFVVFYALGVAITLTFAFLVLTSYSPLLLLPMLIPVAVGLLLILLPHHLLRRLSLYRRYEAWSWRSEMIKSIVVFLVGDQRYDEELREYLTDKNPNNGQRGERLG